MARGDLEVVRTILVPFEVGGATSPVAQTTTGEHPALPSADLRAHASLPRRRQPRPRKMCEGAVELWPAQDLNDDALVAAHLAVGVRQDLAYHSAPSAGR